MASLKKLSSLNLRDTRVTDGGLKKLAGLKKLTMLDLCGRAVTEPATFRSVQFYHPRLVHCELQGWNPEGGTRRLPPFAAFRTASERLAHQTRPLDRIR